MRPLDLADLDSVRAFAGRMREERSRPDVLVNNAGVMAPPRTARPPGGCLVDLPAAGRGPRGVTVSSINRRRGGTRFDDPDGERGYAPMAFCNRSKFANAVFGRELHRRLTEAGSPVRSVLAHPGHTATGLQTKASGPAKVVFGYIGNPLFAQCPVPSARSAARCPSCTRRPIRRWRAAGSSAPAGRPNCGAATRPAYGSPTRRPIRRRAAGCGSSRSA
ncbi:hypothetical protein [Streptomyces sp. NPDC055632]